MKLLHWPLMGGLLHLVQRGGDWVGPQHAQAPLAVPNVTALLSTASVQSLYCCVITQQYGPLLCSFNVGIKGIVNLQKILQLHCVYDGKCYMGFVVNLPDFPAVKEF